MTRRTLRVTLALSNSDEREMYVTYLASHGIEVASLSNAQAVAASLVGDTPELIVVDTRLDGRSDSAETVRTIRHTRVTRSTPLIVITGNPSREFMDEVQRAGATECLLKPVYPEELLEHIRRLLRLPVASTL